MHHYLEQLQFNSNEAEEKKIIFHEQLYCIASEIIILW